MRSWIPAGFALSGWKDSGCDCHGCKKRPVVQSAGTYSQYGLDAYIETRLSDGLEALKPGRGRHSCDRRNGRPSHGEDSTDGAEVRESFREMILQPQSDIPHFRRFVRKIGWQITEEEMVLEDGKFYPMMKVIHGEKDAYFRRYSLYFR